MVKSVQFGRTKRMSYSKIDEVIDMPNLIEIQTSSYQWFLKKGLMEVLKDVSPIVDFSGEVELSFIDKDFDETKPSHTILECKEQDVNYAAPMRVMVRLFNRKTNVIKDQHVYIGEFPVMTETGTFIINGAERVIISQLVRSPGAYFDILKDKTEKNLYTGQIIPNRGAWLEYESDSNDILWVRVDRTRKFHLSILLRSLGLGTNEDIIAKFGEENSLVQTMLKDSCHNEEEGLAELYKKLRPGEPISSEGAKTLLSNMFFEPKRYDLARVGIYKLNKKLMLAARLVGHKAAENIMDEDGEIIAMAGDTLTLEAGQKIQAAGINEVNVYPVLVVGDTVQISDNILKIIGNDRVDCLDYLQHHFSKKELVDFEPKNLGINEMVHTKVLRELIQEAKKETNDVIRELKQLISDHREELMPKNLTTDDIFASISYLIGLEYGVGHKDDIDHLGNRRIRSVGELLQNQMRVGFSRMERNIRERMSALPDIDTATPQQIVNTRPVSAAVKEFFGSSQLSQFMDQQNPLSELTHKRRLSALGPGGLSRDRANFEVRDVHASHYGRMCPIETPEGPNIGLINSLATYAKVNEYGFIETPYRKYDKEKGIVSNEVEYMTADKEDYFHIAQANAPLDDEGHFIKEKVTCRYLDQFMELPREKVDLMDVSPKQLVSVSTSLIPFLGNDDANRALMGSNMQRQAVPLIKPESPIIGTGMEYRAAKDSGICHVARNNGIVEFVSADKIVIRTDNNDFDEYTLTKYQRSNQGNCLNQRPLIRKDDRIKKGDVITDGASTDNGELALGKNMLIGFMTWEGYNYEDAVLINERLVKEDIYTSIHIAEYECEARDTKLGPEEITREIPNVADEGLKDLDEDGIVRIGAEVRSGDVIVGKVTPKGETELTPEERLYRAIFGEKIREVRDTSVRVPHGESGIIVDVKVFTREKGDELKHGVNMLVRVYIAQKRKISVGDKMAGRHGNKGVISRILPEEDMPFMPDGTPLDIVLNPLGVPSRMNIGQLLEVHLGLAAKMMNWKVATPVFDGAVEEDVSNVFALAGVDEDGKTILYDGRTGEPFKSRVTVGIMYYLKLHHLVDEKIHARSIGPYSLVTQQPLGGKAQFGGQRFGEMEVWALEAYGASYTLQEMLTVKSDDVQGRTKTYEAIVKGENIPEAGVPESFKVLVKELQSLCLDVRVYSENNSPIEIKEDEDNGIQIDLEQNNEIKDDIISLNVVDNENENTGFSFGTLNEDGSVVETSEASEDEEDA